MKQLAQRMKDGELRVIETPAPELDDWKVLVRTRASLVSAGTERAKIELARESLIGKARRRPDQVRLVLEKVRKDGLTATIDAVRSRLEALGPLGYCATGRVQAVGPRVRDISPGDIVACGGEEAAHAELIAVPANLCVRVPQGVEPISAAFTTLGSIALHGFHQAGLGLGERVAIVGMGLVGQLTARIARAAGCEVLGVDLEDWRLDLAQRAGAVDLARRSSDIAASDAEGWDAVIVTAAASSNEPVSLAADLARDRGRIVVVGDVPLEFDRRRLYAKELEVRLARSYGPGRHDTEYEQRGLDYPIGYVRWTERRNMAAFLRLVAEGKFELEGLVTHNFTIDEGPRALEVLLEPGERALGVVLEYPASEPETEVESRRIKHPARSFSPGEKVGVVGAGSFARRHLIPLAKRHGLALDRVATSSGLTAVSAAEDFGFERGACTVAELLDDEGISGVIVATRHDRHGPLALDALRAGKAVFVEKPLCLTEDELDDLQSELERPDAAPLMVGFNRRFAPLTMALRKHLAQNEGPTNVLVRVNAGVLPPDHWLNDPVEGGGRLLGEGCHFIDLIAFIAEAEPIAAFAQGQTHTNETRQGAQDFSVTIRFVDGSLGTLLYGTLGSTRIGKEIVEAHRGPLSARIDDFRTLRLWDDRGRSRIHRSRNRDKGHSEEMRLFARVLRGEAEPPASRTYVTSTAMAFAALRSLETGREELVDLPG